MEPNKNHWMRLALEEARLALEQDEVPVGAVVVLDGVLIGRGHNRTRALADPTAHAEMLAITAACETAGVPRLDGAELYVTLEPCPMCAGAMVWARVSKLIYGAADPKAGACGSLMDIARDPRLNHQLEVYGGVLEHEAAALLEQFFQGKRGESLGKE